MGNYVLRCVECGSTISGPMNFYCKCDALVRSIYSRKKLRTRDLPGLWKFYDWLPVRRNSEYDGKPITYKSEHLAKGVGLDDLYISFNGYDPDIGANLKTCTFKELEAAVEIEHAMESNAPRLAVASAGNTARAFAHLASKMNFPVVLIIPNRCLPDVCITESVTPAIKTLVVKDGDYSDAIAVAKKLSAFGIAYDGGARNIARRDAIGTILFDAVLLAKRMPKHYFQAVGSGTGGIAIWEAALRLRDDGRFGTALPRLHLSQNWPFAPMVKAWRARRREMLKEDVDVPDILDVIYARVLSNRYPCYGAKGGLYDALESTNGEMYGITNEEAKIAGKLFESLEGTDVVPAAAVAVASLLRASEEGKINRKDVVLLNISGGGEKRLREEVGVKEIKGIPISKNSSLEELEEAIS